MSWLRLESKRINMINCKNRNFIYLNSHTHMGRSRRSRTFVVYCLYYIELFFLRIWWRCDIKDLSGIKIQSWLEKNNLENKRVVRVEHICWRFLTWRFLTWRFLTSYDIWDFLSDEISNAWSRYRRHVLSLNALHLINQKAWYGERKLRL